MIPFSTQLTLGRNDAELFQQITENAAYCRETFGADPAYGRGRKLIVCGAGPSLHAYLTTPKPADEVWACNSAVPFLMDRGARVTHAIGIDQTEGMVKDWATVYPDIPYLVASSIHPALRDHLLAHGARLIWFHNFLGLRDPDGWVSAICRWCHRGKEGHDDRHDYTPESYEFHLYRTLYPPACYPSYGLNVAVRATGLGLYLNFRKIYVYGSDCGGLSTKGPMPAGDAPNWGEWCRGVTIYADGRTAHDAYGSLGALTQTPVINGRQWITRTDMIVSAQHMVEMVRWAKGRVQLMGTTLPGDMLEAGDDYFTGTRAIPTQKDGVFHGTVLHPDHAIPDALKAVMT